MLIYDPEIWGVGTVSALEGVIEAFWLGLIKFDRRRVLKMKAGIELKGRFHCKNSVHLGADKLEEIFDARVFEMPTIHSAPQLVVAFLQVIGYVNL